MTDKEIIKALECCSSPKANCEDCPCFNKDCISTTPYVLDLINRQQAEIETLKAHEEKEHQYCKNVCEPKYKAEIERLQVRLRKERHQFEDLGKMYSEIRAEAIKEFAGKLTDIFYSHDKGDTYVREVVYNLVKEMAGEDKC